MSAKFAVIFLSLALTCALHSGETVIDPAKAGPDFAVQGEYAGELAKDGAKVKMGAQVIALGKSKFHAVLLTGGLPGDGWEKPKKEEADGQTQDDATTFTHA